MKKLFAIVFCTVLAVISVSCKEEPKIIRLGALVPLSGEAEGYGQQVKNGVTLAMQEINENGGINGRKIDIFFENDESDPEKAKGKVNGLIQQNKVPVIIGGVTSTVALAIAPICEENKVVLISPSATSPKLSGAGQYFFRNFPSDTLEGRVMAEHAVRRMKIKSAAILYMDTEYGQGLKDVFEERFTNLGGRVTFEQGFPEGTTDFVDYIKNIKEAAPESIYLPGYFTEIAAILKEIKEQKLNVKLLTSSGVASPRFFDLAEGAGEGLTFPKPPYDVKSKDGHVVQFVTTYKKKFMSEPDIYAAYAYDSLKIIAKAIEASGPNYPQDIRARVADTSGFNGVTGEISFDANGDVDVPFQIVEVRGSQFAPV